MTFLCIYKRFVSDGIYCILFVNISTTGCPLSNFSPPILPCPLLAQIFLSAPYSRQTSVYCFGPNIPLSAVFQTTFSLLFQPKYSSQRPILDNLQSTVLAQIFLSAPYSRQPSVYCSSVVMRYQVSHPYETTVKVNNSVYLNIYIFG